MRNLEGNQAIVDAVRGDRTGIGYVGIAYAAAAADGLRIFDIAADKNSGYYSPLTGENVESGRYPLTRPLFQMMLDLPAAGGLLSRFLAFEAGPEGRAITARSGYFAPNGEDEEFNRILLDKIGGQ
jgi:phosphate transport system substrate-binding protein